MNSFRTFSRRTFLGGASLVAAHASTPHLPRMPLDADVYVDQVHDLPVLRTGAIQKYFRVCRIWARNQNVVAALTTQLNSSHQRAIVESIRDESRIRHGRQQVTVVFGSWMGAERALLASLDMRLPLYIDDATLAVRLHSIRESKKFSSRSLVGLDAPLDSVTSAAIAQVQSGVIGKVDSLAAMVFPQDGLRTLEAALVAGRVDRDLEVSLRLIETGSAAPTLHMRCSFGSVVLPLFTAPQHEHALASRLSHFDSVSRNEEDSFLPINEVLSLTRHVERLL